ncbi:MAG: hypothetical protein H3C53_05725 [Trueperaceae bacterium]|nr:hypothetical protein [Trueperaceae bacterium]
MTLLSVRALVRLLNTVEPVADLPDATGVAFDSRAVRPGDAFFALPGATAHGLTFADDALARGAALVVADRPHRRGLLVDDARAALLALGRAARDRLTGPVVAVTGSVGKTSTKAMLAAALAARSTPGNLNTHYALAKVLVDAALEDERGTGPGAPGPGAPLVLELGVDRPGEMAELVELTRPDHAVLTHVAASHLSALGDVAGVAREKTLLLDRTPGRLVVGAGAARHLREETLARSVVVTVALAAAAGPAAGPPAHHPGALATLAGAARPRGQGAELTWSLAPRPDGGGTPPGRPSGARHEQAARPTGAGALPGRVTLPWPGAGMAANALAAIAMAELLGTAPEAAARRVAGARLEPGRLERLALAGLTVIDDSYNSNPASLAEAVAVLRACPPPRAAFLADMLELGAAERSAHLAAGELTRDLDLVVAVGPASRAITETNPRAVHVADAAAAARHLASVPRGATVLIKGSRSMRMEALVAEVTRRAADGAWSVPPLPEGAPC